MALDIDQYILFTIYPAAAIFGLGFFARKAKIGESWKYVFQASASIIFSIIYFEARTEWRGARPCRSIIPLWHTLVLYGAEVYDTSGNERTRADCRFSQRILEFAPNYLRSELDRRPPLTTTRSNSQSPPPHI